MWLSFLLDLNIVCIVFPLVYIGVYIQVFCLLYSSTHVFGIICECIYVLCFVVDSNAGTCIYVGDDLRVYSPHSRDIRKCVYETE